MDITSPRLGGGLGRPAPRDQMLGIEAVSAVYSTPLGFTRRISGRGEDAPDSLSWPRLPTSPRCLLRARRAQSGQPAQAPRQRPERPTPGPSRLRPGRCPRLIRQGTGTARRAA